MLLLVYLQVNSLILENLISMESDYKQIDLCACYVDHECLFFVFGHWEINLSSQERNWSLKHNPAWTLGNNSWIEKHFFKMLEWSFNFTTKQMIIWWLLKSLSIAHHFYYILVSLPWFHSLLMHNDDCCYADWDFRSFHLHFLPFPNRTIRGFKSTHSSYNPHDSPKSISCIMIFLPLLLD